MEALQVTQQQQQQKLRCFLILSSQKYYSSSRFASSQMQWNPWMSSSCSHFIWDVSEHFYREPFYSQFWVPKVRPWDSPKWNEGR